MSSKSPEAYSEHYLSVRRARRHRQTSDKTDEQNSGKVKYLEHSFSVGEALKPQQSSFEEEDERQIGKVKYQEGKHGHSRTKQLSILKPDDERDIRSLSSERHVNRESHNNVVKVGELMEIKAMLQFVSSYPVELLDQNEKSKLRESISMLQKWLEECFMDDNPTSSTCLLPICLYGDYVPQRWTDLLQCLDERYSFDDDLRTGFLIKQIPSWAIKSATRQASESILEANMRLVAISGQQAVEVAEALMDTPEIQSKFDIVLYVYVSQHQSIEEVDERIEEQIDKNIQGKTLLLSLEEEKTCRFLLILDGSDDCFINQQTLRTLMDRNYACLVLTTNSANIYQTAGFDVSIRMENHLLPLELFCQHLRQSYHISSSADSEELALDLVDQCNGDLVAVVLLAKELQLQSKDMWDVAFDELKLNHLSHLDEGVSKPMIHVLTFIWKYKDAITKLCLRWFATRSTREELTTSSLVSSWLADGLVQTEGEGVQLSSGLIKSGLLKLDSSSRIIMQKEIKDILLKYVILSLGSPLIARAIVDDAEVINLGNSEVTDLPDSPNCPTSVILCLQNNLDIMVIPPLFFKHMPMLTTLNLSYTSIKTLPPSISELVSLRRLSLRGCELFLELPPEIGQLSDLEVIDLEGTRITHLPNEIAQLKKLQSLKLSFYTFGETRRPSKQLIPKGVLSNLYSLEELWIGKDPDASADEDDDEWIADIQNVLLDRPRESSYEYLSNITLHVPDIRMLLEWRQNYKLIVGHCGQRMISRIPFEVEEKFKQQGNYFQYVNGESIPDKIKDLVKNSNAFILDRHWTVKCLSEFATERIFGLRLCMLVECNELQTILDEDDERFQCIEYLYIYYMKNLKRICSGLVIGNSMGCLKYLSLCTCTSLTSIFTISFLNNLPELEELVVEDCPKMESLVAPSSAREYGDQYLPKLKKISLRELPELVTLSGGLKMAPNLEKLVIFYCPKIESISEVLGGNLKVIKGETEWWDSLSWKETDRLASIFIPLQRDGDLMAQFTED